MTAWDEDFIDEEEEGFFEFNDKGGGEFHFGDVHGRMDCRLTTRDGQPAVEWTWDGNDEMDPAQGRGWAKLEDGELNGLIVIHLGDESGFVAKKAKKRPEKKQWPTSRFGCQTPGASICLMASGQNAWYSEGLGTRRLWSGNWFGAEDSLYPVRRFVPKRGKDWATRFRKMSTRKEIKIRCTTSTRTST